MTRDRSGTTLLELCVTIAIISVAASVVALAARRISAPSLQDAGARIVRARRKAMATNQPVLLQITRNDSVFAVAALPDGEIVADTSLHLDRLSGRNHDAFALPATDHPNQRHGSKSNASTTGQPHAW
jgi:Tfp pilus assembly protein PilE